MSDLKHVPCPTCGKSAPWSESNLYRPFCSERCKLIDLGDWAAEKHRVAGDPINPQDSTDEEDK